MEMSINMMTVATANEKQKKGIQSRFNLSVILSSQATNIKHQDGRLDGLVCSLRKLELVHNRPGSMGNFAKITESPKQQSDNTTQVMGCPLLTTPLFMNLPIKS